MKKIVAEIKGQDWIQAEERSPGVWKIEATGCAAFLKSVQQITLQGSDPTKWNTPKGTDHSSLLLKELILKSQGQWTYPYLHEELCHCRAVPTEIVDQAIMNGAHTPKRVSRETTASTSCTTCRPDVEKIISYRLG